MIHTIKSLTASTSGNQKAKLKTSTKNLEQTGAARKHETEVLAARGIEHSCFGGQLNQFDGDSRSD
jgi:hypothetical protein